MKYFEKYFMAHQYMPKTFHDPYKNPAVPTPIYIMYGPLDNNNNNKVFVQVKQNEMIVKDIYLRKTFLSYKFDKKIEQL